MQKNILIIVVILIVGTVAGIFIGRMLLPYELERGPVYLTETKQVYIQENVALVSAIEKAEKTVVGVKTTTQAGRVLEGSGFVVTSDGLMVTLAELVPYGSDFSFVIGEENVSFQILKRDLENNLALVKISDSVLVTAGFARLDNLKRGERVFLLGSDLVNEGIVKAFDQDVIRTNIIESSSAAGSPLFNISGEILGISMVDAKGNVNAIPISKIRSFVGV